MTPKEKAKELVEKFKAPVYVSDAIHDTMFGDVGLALTQTQSKKYALIALESTQKELRKLLSTFQEAGESIDVIEHIEHVIKDLQEVKQEIQKL